VTEKKKLPVLLSIQYYFKNSAPRRAISSQILIFFESSVICSLDKAEFVILENIHTSLAWSQTNLSVS